MDAFTSLPPPPRRGALLYTYCLGFATKVVFSLADQHNITKIAIYGCKILGYFALVIATDYYTDSSIFHNTAVKHYPCHEENATSTVKYCSYQMATDHQIANGFYKNN
jgi:hypothetical protein